MQEQATGTGINTSSSPFSLLNFFELILACGIIFGADHLMHHVLGFDEGFLIYLGVFYLFKILITFAIRDHRLLSIIAYTCLSVAAVVWPICREWNTWNVTWIGLFICIPMMFLTPSTITFYIDINATRQRSPRFLIWRSVLEIVVIYPPWLFVSSFISLLMGGWWI